MKKTVVLALITMIVVYGTGCEDREAREGEELAKVHCQSCHRLPDPGMLDSKTWINYVLPKMGAFLGFGRFPTGNYYENGKVPGAMPIADWDRIVRYYALQSPDSLEEKEPDITIGFKQFDIGIPSFSVPDPATTCVQVQQDQHQLVFADAVLKRMYTVSPDGQVQDSLSVGEGVVNIRISGDSTWSLAMGVLYPSDEKKGSLSLRVRGKPSSIVLDSLQRPVYAEYVDLNGDGLQDILVCEFGNLSGAVSWFEKISDSKYSKHILRPLPGAIKTQTMDMNGDGLPDVITLMAQGDEGMFIYYNRGNGQFEEKRILQFPPSYGSNSFELADLNRDGHPDIVATNGDNGDYPPILKPYHGIRIYMNDGKNNFKEKVFLPMNGACKAMARDFDGDGDFDIASISYFPDYEHRPEESFLYWDNKGGDSYQPFSFPQADAGRWLTMDAGDLDGDGNIDIVLGNAKFPLGNIPPAIMKKWNNGSPSWLLLKNKSSRSKQ
ncbi:MAG TPA: VCBS repeat-containing protein [Flavisolibacter sp.]|nr:VCBS repeat-containing protein [Flavisolibacter sp.]